MIWIGDYELLKVNDIRDEKKVDNKENTDCNVDRTF